MECPNVDNFLYAIKFPVPKCLIVGEPQQLELLECKMRDALNGRMNVFRSEPFFLELVPNGIDKACSLKVLLDHLGMSHEQMIAIGDGFNDVSMIKYAGLGVAMSNAQEAVKKEADYITLSNEEDGVAAVVEKFILKNQPVKIQFYRRVACVGTCLQVALPLPCIFHPTLQGRVPVSLGYNLHRRFAWVQQIEWYLSHRCAYPLLVDR